MATGWLYRLMPWFLVVGWLATAADKYGTTGSVWRTSALLLFGWATYDYGRERGQRQMADDLMQVFRRRVRR